VLYALLFILYALCFVFDEGWGGVITLLLSYKSFQFFSNWDYNEKNNK